MPETEQGTCPWCERHDQTLFFAIGCRNGRLWYDWVCARCLSTVNELNQEVER